MPGTRYKMQLHIWEFTLQQFHIVLPVERAIVVALNHIDWEWLTGAAINFDNPVSHCANPIGRQPMRLKGVAVANKVQEFWVVGIGSKNALHGFPKGSRQFEKPAIDPP